MTSHYLLRRPTAAPYGPLEIIAEDARVGTRAAAVTVKGESAVVYIALPKVKDGPLRARLWLERQAPKTAVDVTESGNTSAASIPLALSKMQEADPLPSGSPVLLFAFGGGLAYAGQVVKMP